MAEPCPSCGVRGDVDCPHRPGQGAEPPAIADPEEQRDGRRAAKPGNGRNFRRKKR